MIPKTIHYCWFGRNPMPSLAKKCIKSWKKYCKEYRIMAWSEDTFDIASAPLYVRQAYEAKKWAFVTDYVRLWAMYTYGGFYMDTDVEVIKPLDGFLGYDAVSGYESDQHIPTGLMGCSKGFPLFGELMREYDDIPFIKDDGSYDTTTNVIRITNKCKEYGFVPDGQLQSIEGFTIFPKDYFCPKNGVSGELFLTENSYTIHWFNASWYSPEQKQALKEKLKYLKREKERKKRNLCINRIKKGIRNIIGERNYEKLKILRRGKDV